MKRVFRSRLRPPLTSSQIETLTSQSHLSSEELEEWYERFYHCYPRGYLSQKEFLTYLQQLQSQNPNTDKKNQLAKPLVKKLYRLLDLNDDKQLNFEEFFLFNILINRGTMQDKLKLVFKIYDRKKNKQISKEELEIALGVMFDIVQLPIPNDGLTGRIDMILNRANFNSADSKISWHTFSTYVLNDSSLFQLLICNETDEVYFNDHFTIITTRF